ncbi:nucleotide sugar dehydrogenase, partial [Alphaproteobacteria bacterium]|nr:nucleotide sugar dehydrogenase [Alphaproteobacteria bacterium]
MEIGTLSDIKLAVIGLGYVGLPLSVEFAKTRKVIGYDLDRTRIEQLSSGIDKTNEISAPELQNLNNLFLTSEKKDLESCNCFIITVPTPIDANKVPDLSSLSLASETVASLVSPGNIIIFESTVYPGVTEDFCAPLIARNSSLEYSQKTMPKGSNVFYLGYSPERVNPGDKQRKLKDVVKVVSGSTDEVTAIINKLYESIISAGTYVAESIRIAEAAKVIENVQRDLNIALINEFS